MNIWCWPTGSGEVYGYRMDEKMPTAVRAGVTPKANADKDVGQWNAFEITMKGDRLTVVLNGVTVLENAQLPGVPAQGPDRPPAPRPEEGRRLDRPALARPVPQHLDQGAEVAAAATGAPVPHDAAGRLRGLAQNLGLLAAASLLAVAGAEWLLRTYAPQAGFVYRLDPRCLYTLAPGTRKLYRNSEPNGGRRVLFVVNSDGFRGDALRRDPGLRVLVYGDSFVEADYTPLPETFTKRLEARLASALARDVEAVNAGVAGYGPDQALRRFEDEAGEAAPRGGGPGGAYAGNDFGDVLRNRLYRLEGGRLVDGGRLRGGQPVVAVRGRPAADALPPPEGTEAAPSTPIGARTRPPSSTGSSRYTSPGRWRCARRTTGGSWCRASGPSTTSSVTTTTRTSRSPRTPLPRPTSGTCSRPSSAGGGTRPRRRACRSSRSSSPRPIDVCDAFDVKVDRAAYPGTTLPA